MGRFLDQRSSMNIGGVGLTSIPVTSTPVLFGVIGLQTQGVTNPIVNLHGTIGLTSEESGATVLIQIARGTTTTNSVIYSAILRTEEEEDTRSFGAQDLLAPAAAEVAYSVFVSTESDDDITRIGPESFYGIASATS